MDLSVLPTLNASLNATSAFLLMLGYAFIRQKAITAHTISMLLAFLASSLFLLSYLVYHAFHGATPFPRFGWIRWVYFFILVSHTALAILIVPLVLATLIRALRGDFHRHAALARWTLPLWLYVSVTGVLVYGMLYHL